MGSVPIEEPLSCILVKKSCIESQSCRDFRDLLIELFILEAKKLWSKGSEGLIQRHIMCWCWILLRSLGFTLGLSSG